MNRIDNAFLEISKTINEYNRLDKRLLLALDGRCASGKTTLASRLESKTGCLVLHMDDFFLRPEQRTESRLQEPGGNVDYERFLEEALIPISKKQSFSYCPFDCSRQEFSDRIYFEPKDIIVVEGAYSCHPALWNYYDMHIFLSIDKNEQLRRILNRNGKDALLSFEEKWIPLEERYFEAYDIEKRCDMCF